MSYREPLHRRTFRAVLICGLMYLFLLYALPMILYGFGMQEPWPILIVIGANALLWFVLVPFGLGLPNGRESFRDYLTSIGIKSRLPLPHGSLLGLLVFCAWGVCFLVPAAVFGRFDPDPAILSQWMIWLIALNAGVFEEIALRGVILNILWKRFAEWPAILICSALFGLGHAATALFGGTLLDALVKIGYAFLFGVFFAYLFVKTRSLIPGILAHFLIDAPGKVLLEPLIRPEVNPAERNVILLIGAFAATLAVLLLCKYVIPLLQREKYRQRVLLPPEKISKNEFRSLRLGI